MISFGIGWLIGIVISSIALALMGLSAYAIAMGIAGSLVVLMVVLLVLSWSAIDDQIKREFDDDK